MKTIKENKCMLKVADSSAFKILTPDHMYKLHSITVVIGKRGSGKSVFVSNALRMFKEAKCLDRILIISPTFGSNKQILNNLDIDLDDDVFEDPDDPTLPERIISIVETEAKAYEDYHEKMKKYKALQKAFKESKLANDELLLEFFWNGKFEKPEHRYNGKKPVLALFVDDSQSTRLFSNRKFLNLITRHRHVGQLKEGGALGISIFIAVQNYKSTNGGLPRTIRNNSTHLAIFRTKDQHELKQICDECSGEVSEDTFYKVYEFATQEPHSFLFIDLHKKDNHPSMFRKRLDEFILLS